MALASVIIPQAESIQQMTLVAAAAYTSSDATNWWPCDFLSSEEITTVVTTCSGTLNVYLQKLLPDNATAADIGAFSQYTTAVFTTSGAKTLSFVNGGNSFVTETDAALTAGTVNTVHFGTYQRIKFVIAGTGATATFGVF